MECICQRLASIVSITIRFTPVITPIIKQENAFKKNQPTAVKCRGKPKRSKAHNLLIALNSHSRAILAFLKEDYIPFDNNLAERDIRMIKTKQKVSGCLSPYLLKIQGKENYRLAGFVTIL